MILVLSLLVRQIEVIEKTIGAGQVEELIEQAKDELVLIPQYAGASGRPCSAFGHLQ